MAESNGSEVKLAPPLKKGTPPPTVSPSPLSNPSQTLHHDNVITHVEPAPVQLKKPSAPEIPADDANVITGYETQVVSDDVQQKPQQPLPHLKDISNDPPITVITPKKTPIPSAAD